MQYRDQACVEAHIAVEDMAELVGNHPLQLFTREQADCPAGNPDHRILRRQAGGKGIDPHIIQHIHRRHRGARGQSHLLHHIKQALFFQALRREVDQTPTQPFGHRLTATAELQALVEAAQQHHTDYGQGDHPHLCPAGQ